MIIAVDGPAGSGKSTVSKALARLLGLLYIDTGAMYRALTLKAVRGGVDLSDEKALAELARRTRIRLVLQGERCQVMLDGEDVSALIRTPELTEQVKFVAKVPGVREEMVRLQREVAAQTRGAILDGRDIGTVVFPNADKKFYLDADLAERARRRHAELAQGGLPVDPAKLQKDMAARDESDRTRAVGPLCIASDAIVIDTTRLSIEEVVQTLLRHTRSA